MVPGRRNAANADIVMTPVSLEMRSNTARIFGDEDIFYSVSATTQSAVPLMVVVPSRRLPDGFSKIEFSYKKSDSIVMEASVFLGAYAPWCSATPNQLARLESEVGWEAFEVSSIEQYWCYAACAQ